MTKAKKIFTFFVLFLLIFIFAFSFSPQVNAATTEKTTDGKWTGKNKTENLVALTAGKLSEQGWYITVPDKVKEEAVDKNNYSEIEDVFTNQYGIQARDNKDIGDDDYTNGVWIRIKLSDADIEKANKGDLTIDASARYYRQAAASHHCSVQIFFESGTNYTALSNIGTKKKISKNGDVLTISGKVPAGTTAFRYYVSNHGSLLGKAFIGDLRCTLSDKTAPKMTSVTFDNSSITDQENNVAVSGNTLIYDLNFDEKIKSIEKTSTYTGIATLMFEDGSDPDLTASPTLVHENGKSKVRYTFTLPTLPDIYHIGKLYISSIDNLKVLDEGSNATIIRGSVDSPKIQYYRNMKVTMKLVDLTYSVQGTIKYNTDFIATLKPSNGYNLPSSIIITIGGNRLSTSKYTYNQTTGAIRINGKSLIGDIM